MNISKVSVSISVMLLFVFLLSACTGEQRDNQPTSESRVDNVVEQVSEPVVKPTNELVPEPTAKPTIEKMPEPTTEPTALPEIEPEIVDLGNNAWLLIRGLPDDVTYDVNIDLALKDEIPDSRNFDYVHSEIAAVTLTKNSEPTIIEKGIVELCYSTTLIAGYDNEKPIPYYWDTSQNPLVDGMSIRMSTLEKEPDLVVCMMLDKSGAYGLIAR